MAKSGTAKIRAAARGRRPEQRAESECQRQANERFARAHPARSREERALRRRAAEVARRFGGNDFAAGTPETRYHASTVRQGALARLYLSGAIGADQLACAGEIATVAERIGRDVTVRTVSLETRISGGGGGHGLETLRQVRSEAAYTAWRANAAAMSRHGPGPVLAMIVDDCGVNEVARRFGMDKRTAGKLLGEALDAWPRHCADAWRGIDNADVKAVEARLR